MLSTFGGFSLAKLGIRASQQGLQITGNNISNINTNGYTRQRINQISLHGGVADRYASSTDVRIGMGTLVTNVSQIRDPYLDIRYRNEASSVGYYDQKLGGIEDLQAVLDEVMKDGIHTGLEDLRTQLQNMANGSTGDQTSDSNVRAAAQSLVALLNSYSAKLDELKENTVTGFTQDVDAVNDILNNIRDLNEDIRNSQLHGDNALELVDRRNTLIDQLSEYTKIKVTYYDEKISEGVVVDRLVIELDAPGQDPANRLTLIDGLYANQLEIEKPADANGNFDINLTGLKDKTGDSPLVNEIQAQMKQLNTLTQALAGVNKSLKDLHTQRTDWAKAAANAGFNQNGVDDFQDIDGTRKKLQADADAKLEAYRKNPSDATKKAWQDAQSKLSNYNQLAKQKSDLDRQFTSLTSQRDGYTKTLTDALDAQGFSAANGNLTITTDPDTGASSFTVVVKDPATGLPKNCPIVTADGTMPNTFGAQPVLDQNGAPTGDYAAQIGGNTFKTYDKAAIDQAADVGTDLNDGELYGVLQARLDELNGKGTCDPDGATDIRGIAYYQRSLDAFAQTLAETLNKINNIDPNDPDKSDLFEAAGGAANITAGNIKISQDWLDGKVHINASTDPNAPDASTDNTNIFNMINALNGKHEFYALDADGNKIQDGGADRVLFNGSLEEMFTNMNAVLGSDAKTTTTLLNNYATAANERAVARDNISSVDLNEEGINLIQYQKSFSAACRVMTTLDQMLDSILNMGVVGR